MSKASDKEERKRERSSVKKEEKKKRGKILRVKPIRTSQRAELTPNCDAGKYLNPLFVQSMYFSNLDHKPKVM